MFLKLRVHPEAKRDAVSRKAPDLYELWVRAPAERGLANKAVRALMGTELGIPAGRIRLVKGSASPSKIIEVPG